MQVSEKHPPFTDLAHSESILNTKGREKVFSDFCLMARDAGVAV